MPAAKITRDPTDPERLIDERRIDEMVLALTGMRNIDNEGRCIVELIQQGFRAYEVADWLDEALTLARMVRADGGHEPVQVSRDV